MMQDQYVCLTCRRDGMRYRDRRFMDCLQSWHHLCETAWAVACHHYGNKKKAKREVVAIA